jgi:predicted kinase
MEAIILSGIQGAGKSTYCREHYWDTHIRINYDMLKTRHRETLLVDAMIEAKQPFVVDNTNATHEDRARYILPSRKAGFRLIGLEFIVTVDLALQRNERRMGKMRIPEIAIRGTERRLEPLDYQEGFDQIFHIRSLDGMQFQIDEVQR